MSSKLTRLAYTALVALAIMGLSGCAPTVNMEPAQYANNPHCADVSVRVPNRIDHLEIRNTNAQAAYAWGDPAIVLARCGLALQGPTGLACVNVNQVDWVIDDSKFPHVRAVTYGRDPGLEVVMNNTSISSTSVLTELSAVAKYLPAKRFCQV